MLAIVNPYAGGGTAKASWSRVRPKIRQRFGPFDQVLLPTVDRLKTEVGNALSRGERIFIAAGGDGTVQCVLQALMTVDDGRYGDIYLGAVGLGSSNDFHKPLCKETSIGGVPCALSVPGARRRDIGVLNVESSTGAMVTRYWLVNCSIGVTAEANAFFNAPDALLTRLKAWFTPAAILYAALHSVFRTSNRHVRLCEKTNPDKFIELTNLAVLKSPHCSGSLCFSIPFDPDNGRFHVHLSEKMARLDRLTMLFRLALHRTNGIKQSSSWTTDDLRIEADSPFAVEFDGEVLRTRIARFAIQPRRMLVCS